MESNTAIFIFFFLLNSTLNPIALKKTKIVYNFGLSECNRVKEINMLLRINPISKWILHSGKQTVTKVVSLWIYRRKTWQCTHFLKMLFWNWCIMFVWPKILRKEDCWFHLHICSRKLTQVQFFFNGRYLNTFQDLFWNTFLQYVYLF